MFILKFSFQLLVHFILYIGLGLLKEQTTNSTIQAGLLTLEFILLIIFGFEFIKFVLYLCKLIGISYRRILSKINRL